MTQDRTYFIYVISRVSDGRAVYVGQTVDPHKRWRGHRCTKKSGQAITAAIAKHGVAAFRFEALPVTFATRAEADEAEIHLIAALRTTVRGGGYNISPGGNGPGKIGEETRAKMSAKQRGRRLPPEWRANIGRGVRASEQKKPYRDEFERFLDKIAVPPDVLTGCWLWTAMLDRDGYGLFSAGRHRLGNKQVVRASRYAYEHLVGPVLDGQFVLRSCPNNACVNPAHLRLGDHKGCATTRRARGSYRFGADHHNSREKRRAENK